MLRQKNGGSLKGNSVDDIIELVSEYITKKYQKVVSASVPPPFRLPENFAADFEECCICRENLNNDSVTSSCDHKFHKEVSSLIFTTYRPSRYIAYLSLL